MTERRGRRLAVTMLDQLGFSGLSFATTMLVASQVSAGAFGRFALLQVVFTLLLGLARTTVGQTTLLEARSPQALGPSTGVVLICVVGTGVSFILWMPYVIVGSTTFLWAGLLGTSLAPMIVLDVIRHSLHGLQRHGAACTASGAAASGYAVAVGLGWIAGAPVAVSAVAAMSVGACAGAVIGTVLVGGLERPQPLSRWVRAQSTEWREAAAGFAANSTGFILVPVILALVAGSAAAGALRAGQVIVGFAQQVPNGMTMLMLERSASAVSQRSKRMLDQFLWTWTGGTLPIFAALLGAAVLWPAMGERVLGETWSQTSRIVVPLLVSGFLTCVSLGLEVQLRALRSPSVSARARTVGVVTMCAAVAVGAQAYGLVGGVVGLLVGNLVQVSALARGRRRVIGAEHWQG